MKSERNLLISYALSFVSFLARRIKSFDKINSIFLFGSVARGDFRSDSDVDLFIDCESKEVEKEVEKAVEQFYETEIFKFWEKIGVKNKISVIVGKVEEWEVGEAILQDSILLFSRFPMFERGKRYYLIWWEKAEKVSRTKAFRKIFGFKYKGKEYKGISSSYDIRKIGKNALLLEEEAFLPTSRILLNANIKFKAIRVLLKTPQKF